MANEMFQNISNQIVDPSDAIYFSPDLTEKDRAFAKKMLNNAKKRIDEDKSLFSVLEEQKILKATDYAIKAVLQHNINKRRGK